MATMFRVSIPDDDGVVTVSTSVTAFSTCTATEVALVVGSSVPTARLSSELRDLLNRWAAVPRSALTVVATQKATWTGLPAVLGDQLAFDGAVAGATAPDETLWGIVVGHTAALDLDKGLWFKGALDRIAAALTPALGT